MNTPVPSSEPDPPESPPGVRDLLWRAAGGVMFALGAIGLVLPVWPTTIFWILAALAFARSWPRMRDRLYAWPRLGPTIAAFAEHGVMSRSAKRHGVDYENWSFLPFLRIVRK